jgi:hypothetical protein
LRRIFLVQRPFRKTGSELCERLADGGCIVPNDQTATLELIAAQLAYLRAQAEANDLNLVAFLIDVALSEAREELASSAKNSRSPAGPRP